METATRRMSTLPRYAGGGFIDGLKRAVGLKEDSPELKAYKERAAAERAKPTPTAPSAITSYSDGSTAAKRMKAVDAMANGGAIKGKGTGTSDEVPIMASNGEYVIRAAAVEEVGKEVLDAINKLGDDNEPDEAMESETGEAPDTESKAEDSRPAMKKGGAVRCMAMGGIIDKYGNQVPQAPSRPIGAMARNVADTLAPNTMDAVSNTVSGASNEFAKGQYAAGAGQLARGGIGAGVAMMQDAMTPAFAVANTVGNAVGEFGRGFMREPAVAPGAPVAQPTVTAPAPIPAAAAPAAPQPRPGAPNPASGSPDEVMPSGKVNVSKQANGVMSFSGKDVSGQPQYTGSAANTMKAGAMNTMQAMPQAEINRALTNPDGSRWSANDNAIMAANIRDGVNPYRGTSRGIAEAAQNDLQNLALSPNGTPGKANAMAMLTMQSGDKRAAGQQQIERDHNDAQTRLAQNKDGREAAASTMDQKARQQLMDAQEEYLNAGDDSVKQKAAERKLITLGGKQPNDKGQVITLPDTLGDQGQVIRGGQAVLMPDGTIVRPEQGQTKTGGVQAPTTKAEYDKLPKGAKYTHPDGTTRTKG